MVRSFFNNYNFFLLIFYWFELKKIDLNKLFDFSKNKDT